MITRRATDPQGVLALKVHQWLSMWEEVAFDETARRRRPDPYFYLFTLPAPDLKALAGIYRRTTEGGLRRSQDLGIERPHDERRSQEIKEFVRYGYPWSELSQPMRQSGKYRDLLKPGWLPTAVVVNILKKGDRRLGRAVSEEDLVTVEDADERRAVIRVPDGFRGAGWRPAEAPPLEVIDGQHRLWAFEDYDLPEEFELPVVAFHGLDISWQAYLFWTINIKPKRISPSLAFDMYPLLRTEDWLERFEGPSVYRQARAQELTEALWSHELSPWYHRINMLGVSGGGGVSQAGWVQSLLATYIRSSQGKGTRIGGLFGAPVGADELTLPWKRAQQSAFLIFVWRVVQAAISECDEDWAQHLRQGTLDGLLRDPIDPAFSGGHTLLNTDQGVRGILFVTNDLCFVRSDDLGLANWAIDEDAGAVDDKAVAEGVQSLDSLPVASFIKDTAKRLSTYDWRTASAPGLTESERTAKLAFRGSGGYRELRRQLLKHLMAGGGDPATAAEQVSRVLRYTQ